MDPPDGSSIPQSSIRQKQDIAWNYVTQSRDDKGRLVLTCGFCKKQNLGGRINRMKHHLAGQKGNVQTCKNVPPEVQHRMREALKENEEKKKEKRGLFRDVNIVGPDLEDVNVGGDYEGPLFRDSQPSLPPSQRRKVNPNTYFKMGFNDPTQPTIKACMQSKEKVHDTDLAVALWFYDACIPMNAVNSPLFPLMISKVASMGHGYTGPSYYALRVGLLPDAKHQVSLTIETFRSTWAETGCTLMGDGWKDTRQRPLINFLVYCPKGVTFIKSVDASDIYASAENLCNLFAEIVEMVGPTNVIHLVTDNAPNYKAAGGLLVDRYPTLHWSPCAAHCINLILEDIGKLRDVEELANSASKVTVFAYNHKWTLNYLRKRVGWKEIIRPGETRFATTFIALQSLYQRRDDLQAMVTDQEFRQYLKTQKGKVVKQVVLDESFWNSCLVIVRMMAPIIRLLRICDADEKPSLPYVYEGMYRAKLGIKKLCKMKKDLYKPYTNVIKRRWDRMLRHDLHAAAYYLNPAFMYDQDNFSKKAEIMTGMLNLIDKQDSHSTRKMIDDLSYYRERERGFSRPTALMCSKTTRPDVWWKTFGHDVPKLQKLAIRILSQTSSSGCERNWSVFERIHTKRRNKLEHQRLNDLVFVHYNLRLQDRSSKAKRAYDPVDYESIDKTEFWIVEEEGDAELDYDDLETALLEEHPKNGEESNSRNPNGEEDEILTQGNVVDGLDDYDFDS